MITRIVSARIGVMSFICAILVVTIHSAICSPIGSWQSVFSTVITVLNSVAVPFFFAAAGFLLAGRMGESGWWKCAVVKRIRSLIVPFYLWIVFYTLFTLALHWVAAAFCVEYAGEHLNLNVGSLTYLCGVNPFRLTPVVWFLRALFFCVLISPIVAVLSKRMLTLALVAFFALYVFHESHSYADADWKCFFDFFISLRGIFYFSFGVYVRRFVKQEYIECRWRALGCSVVLFVLMTALRSLRIFPCPSTLAQTFFLLILLWSVIGLAIDQNGAWGKLQRFAMPIYLCHFFLVLILAAVVKACGLKSLASTSVAWFLCKVSIATIGSCVLCSFGRRCAPRITSFILGGR